MNQQAISAGHEVNLAIAKEILHAGGNAFDAAVAVGFAMFITEPCMASAGGGGFAMCFSQEKGISMLDFFTQTPGSKPLEMDPDFYPIKVNFGTEVETFHVGLASAAVPGMVAGLYALNERFGTMPMEELLQPAMELAKKGVKLNTFQAYDLVLLASIFRIDPEMREYFFTNDAPKKEGELLFLPRFADFLDFLRYEGAKGFYQGEISQIIDRDSKERGGFLRRADFEDYEVYWRKPLAISRNDLEFMLPNGPSLGGAIMAFIFKELAEKLETEKPSDIWSSIFAGIKEKYPHPLQLAKAVQAHFPGWRYQMSGGPLSTRGTSHFNILDKWGNAIAMTYSIGEGCGYFIPGTDMQLNNMMGEAFLLPKGFHSWQPGSRLNSMMSPTMVLDPKLGVRFAGGSGGAERIPFMIAQVIEKLIREGMALEAAIESPRVHVQSGTLHLEKNVAQPSSSYNLEVKQWDQKSMFFGGVHGIWVDQQNNVFAHGDSRRYGCGEVF